MEPRAVAMSNGWRWIVDGFRLFRRQPLIWILLLGALMLIGLVSTLLQPVGPLAISLLTPVFIAGLMNACLITDRGGEPDIGHLFSAFRGHAAPLVTIGGVYLVGNIVAVGVVLMGAGNEALQVVLSRTRNEAAMAQALRDLSSGLLTGTLVFMPVLMAVWFAPLLVVFRGMTPVAAMKSSLQACWRNLLPFTLYGAAIVVLWIIASIPLMLGLVVLLPVMACSVYTAYKDLYGEVEVEAPPAGDSTA
ncbi:MAG: hypothetical protein FJY44_05065 [Betaproteobacteria bacterium]|nr:hypothetical protein [Betaproteobacteria bacterium]